MINSAKNLLHCQDIHVSIILTSNLLIRISKNEYKADYKDCVCLSARVYACAYIFVAILYGDECVSVLLCILIM